MRRFRKHRDDLARGLVKQFEEEARRNPTVMDENHPGYDVSSEDAEERVVRRIEIKGVGREWTGDCTCWH